jgi:hypothetical protein
MLNGDSVVTLKKGKCRFQIVFTDITPRADNVGPNFN